jgi:hypothetical protein
MIPHLDAWLNLSAMKEDVVQMRPRRTLDVGCVVFRRMHFSCVSQSSMFSNATCWKLAFFLSILMKHTVSPPRP